jgi:hypothetical protein
MIIDRQGNFGMRKILTGHFYGASAVDLCALGAAQAGGPGLDDLSKPN